MFTKLPNLCKPLTFRANASAVITNFVLAEMTQAYTSSELAAAYEIISGGANFRPHVIAIADVFTSKLHLP